MLSCVRLFVNPRTAAFLPPLSMGFSRQEYWSGLPFPSPGDLPDPGLKLVSPASLWQVDYSPLSHQGNHRDRHGTQEWPTRCAGNVPGRLWERLFWSWKRGTERTCSSSRQELYLEVMSCSLLEVWSWSQHSDSQTERYRACHLKVEVRHRSSQPGLLGTAYQTRSYNPWKYLTLSQFESKRLLLAAQSFLTCTHTRKAGNP